MIEKCLNFAECLVEILCEKMPPMPQLEQQVNEMVYKWLQNYQNTDNSSVEVHVTPYRVFFCINKLPVKLKKHGRKIKGPITTTSEKTLTQFRNKLSNKAEVYEENGFYWAKEEGESVEAKFLLPKMIEEIITNIEPPERMGWGREITWIRPIRRIVCVFDGSPIIHTFELLGIKSSVESLFFLNDSANDFCFDSYKSYIGWLKSKNILINSEERKSYIKAAVRSALKNKEESDPGHLESIATITSNRFEAIKIYRCEYTDNFNLPEEIRNHVIIQEEKHLPIKNGLTIIFSESDLSDEGAQFTQDTAKAIYNRLEEVDKYWALTISKTPEEYIELSKTTPAESGIGSIRGQSERIKKLLTNPSSALKIAAEYVSLDSLMDISLEIPVLRGIAASEYMKYSGLDKEAATIVRESIFPRQDEEIKKGLDKNAAILSFFKRLDLVVGLVNVHNLPKGSSDPFAIRRQVFAILKLGFYIDGLPKLGMLVEEVILSYEEQGLHIKKGLYAELMRFFGEKNATLLEKVDPVYGRIFSTNDITWNEYKLLKEFLSSEPEKLMGVIGTTKKRLEGILKTSFGGEGSETSIKFFQPVADLLEKEKPLSLKYITELCDAINSALNQNKPIKDLTPKKISDVIKLLQLARTKLAEYCA